ncbi:MAG: SxtJ family membrane protein [Planctomycetota bacterium]|jgi:hypothetical protein|nr:SxtJ family membrane protein [Planctomycetota bacterium]
MIKLDLKPKNETVRQFGWIALFGFPLAGLALTQWPGSLPINTLWVLVGLGVACGLAAVANVPVILRPIYLAMTLLAFPIGLMISTVLLSTIYFLLFTPVGLFFRLTGKDPLERRIDPSAPTYWRTRGAQRAPSSYLRLY